MIRLFAVLALTASLVLHTEESASAVDTRPCVTNSEFYNFDMSWTRTRVERFFDVTTSEPDPLNTTEWRYARKYKACGYSLSEAYVVVQYRRSDDVTTMAFRWVADGATPSRTSVRV